MSEQGADKQTILDATSLVELVREAIPLQQRGREWVGVCPFHDDHDPSLCVVTHKGHAFYKCHACGAAGDAITFVRQYHHMEFNDAMRYLADRVGLEWVPSFRGPGAESGSNHNERSALMDANAAAGKFFRLRLLDEQSGAEARTAITERGMTDEICEAFQIGYAPLGYDTLLSAIRKRGGDVGTYTRAGVLKQRQDGSGQYDAFRHRMIFPICDELGRPIAFGGRRLDPEDNPKYLNSPESPVFDKSRTLYGLHLAKRAIEEAGVAIVTEGYTDVIACHQAGIRNVVATLGTALTTAHATVLGRFCDRVVLVFDGDAAGQKAADRAVEIFFKSRVDVRICVLPGDADPDDMLRSEHGPEQFRALIDDAVDSLEFRLRRYEHAMEQASSLSARQSVIEQAVHELADLGLHALAGVRRTLMLERLQGVLGVQATELDEMLRSLGARRRGDKPIRRNAAATTSRDESARPAGRVAAERTLVGIILSEPGLRREVVQIADAALALQDALPRLVADDAVAATIVELLTGEFSNADPNIQQITGALGHDALIRDAIAMLEVGEQVISHATDGIDDVLQRAVDAISDLETRARFEADVHRYRSESGNQEADAGSIAALIEGRRRLNVNAGALPRVRSDA